MRMILRGFLIAAVWFCLFMIHALIRDAEWLKAAYWLVLVIGLATYIYAFLERKSEKGNDRLLNSMKKGDGKSKDLVCIKTYLDESSAQPDKAALEDQGIHVIITTHYSEGVQEWPAGNYGKPTAYWFEVKTGGVRLSVKEKDVARANEILKDKYE